MRWSIYHKTYFIDRAKLVLPGDSTYFIEKFFTANSVTANPDHNHIMQEQTSKLLLQYSDSYLLAYAMPSLPQSILHPV